MYHRQTKQFMSREKGLEEMSNGIKQKFHSLADNDPQRLSILTMAPQCWSVRKTAGEFSTSFRMAKAAKDLRESEGVLASPSRKRGKTLP